MVSRLHTAGYTPYYISASSRLDFIGFADYGTSVPASSILFPSAHYDLVSAVPEGFSHIISPHDESVIYFIGLFEVIVSNIEN